MKTPHRAFVSSAAFRISILPGFESGDNCDHVCAKCVYPSKRDALTALNAALKRRRHRPECLRAYPCAACNGWHLTHTFKQAAYRKTLLMRSGRRREAEARGAFPRTVNWPINVEILDLFDF